jgi:hypothetical protein
VRVVLGQGRAGLGVARVVVTGSSNRSARGGVTARVDEGVRARRRVASVRQCGKPRPSAGTLDSKTAQAAAGGPGRGCGAANRPQGRKRHVRADSSGHRSPCVTRAADVPEDDGGTAV